MKTIKLTQGYETIVDDSDYEWLNQWKWCVHRKKNTSYAQRRINGKTIRMHRLILGILDKPEFQADHINCDGLDNRRINLRLANHTQNCRNSRKILIYRGKPTSSIYKGVSWYKAYRRWRAKVSGKHIGYFDTEEEAAHAYNEFVKENFGEFARLNDI